MMSWIDEADEAIFTAWRRAGDKFHEVDLAAIIADHAPGWHPRPTGPGLWITRGGTINYVEDQEDIEVCAVIAKGWYGPIPNPEGRDI